MSRPDFVPMAGIVPEGSSGIAHIEHFNVSEEEAKWTAVRAAVTGHGGTFVPPGKYARLMVDRTLYMTDTPHEHRTNYEVVRRATGDVLIAGLGLGMLLIPILQKPEVTSVTVVEKYADVVDLVEAPIRNALRRLIRPTVNDKLAIITADIYRWKPGPKEKFDVIYFDIWADQSTDELGNMDILHRTFRKYRKKGGWMDSWNREFLKSQKRRGR